MSFMACVPLISPGIKPSTEKAVKQMLNWSLVSVHTRDILTLIYISRNLKGLIPTLLFKYNNVLLWDRLCYFRQRYVVTEILFFITLYKTTAESLSQHDEKHVVPTPFSGLRVGKRRRV
jgi:hypothetical protein